MARIKKILKFMLKNDISQQSHKEKPKLLLHICCAGCGAYVSQILKKDYQVYFYFYNPSIFPEKEYKQRLKDVQRIAKKFSIKLFIEKNNYQKWKEKIKNYEQEPEKGLRCDICFQNRLENTAQKSKEEKIFYFTTTLTTSPHKNAEKINQIGQKVAKKYNLEFLSNNFKKQNGFKKSSELAKKLNIYCQNYCGCEFSIK